MLTSSRDPEIFTANVQHLLAIVKKHLPRLEILLEEMNLLQEILIYRCYQGSFKAYVFQEKTLEVVSLFREIGEIEGLTLHEYFEEVVSAGTGQRNLNQEWTVGQRPILEAFMHVRLFLEIMVKYAKNTEPMPSYISYGWLGVHELYGLGC
jgi:hypothetical protein